MTWRDDLRRVTLSDGRKLIGASFRGAAFLVESSERGGGRRAVVHEFPGRDDPYVEDLGRGARRFRVDGYVIGDDYLAQRDALLSALEDIAGPGELVHPYHGVRRAICMTVSVRESRTDGGMALFAIDFAETPSQAPVPVEVVDGPEQVGGGADAAITASETEFVEQYDPEGLPGFAFASAELALTEATASLETALAPIVTSSQELAELTSRATIITATAASLVREPAAVLGEFRAAITGLVETVAAAPGAVMEALFDAYLADLGTPVVASTATRARELSNQSAFVGALRRVIAIEAARLAPLVPYESIEEASAARDRVAELLDDQAGVAGDTAYPAIVDLRSQVMRAVPGGSAFARLVTVTRATPIPSLVLAYQLYGDVDKEPDIVARNAIRHPGFVAGDIKVLSDE